VQLSAIRIRWRDARGGRLARHGAHSLNPVPFVFTASAGALDGEGFLADAALTALALLRMEQPQEMTGRSLLA
jgi:2,3-bisphosphoglycerate-independent phosphoglycerate mutase